MAWSKKYCRETFAEAIEVYRAEHEWCALCGIPEAQTWRFCYPGGLQLAHVFAGCHRKDVPENVLMLCSTCHGRQHAGGNRFNGVDMPPITLGVLLALKREMGELKCDVLENVTGYKAAWIAEQVSEAPQYYLELRGRWRRG